MDTQKYKNKYRIASARLQNWNYGWNAAYFVTICTKGRLCYFGNIVETQNFASLPEIQLSEIGRLAYDCWFQIPEHFPFVKLGGFIVMPNHVHGIVIIDKVDDGRGFHDSFAGNIETQNIVEETQNIASLPRGRRKPVNQFGPQSQNLASIIRGFKIGVTKNARQIKSDFAWQPRFHDHIIRNDASFERISNYIKNNVILWEKDTFHMGNR